MDKNWQDKFDSDREACKAILKREKDFMKDEFYPALRKAITEVVIVLLLCLLALFFLTITVLEHSPPKARGAPAPFWKERDTHTAETHPAAMCGWYEVVFRGDVYRAGLDDDGTFRVCVKGSTDFKWRGTWGVRDGVLYWREWSWAKCPWEVDKGTLVWRNAPDPDWRFEFTYKGDGWKSDSTTVRFLHFITPTD